MRHAVFKRIQFFNGHPPERCIGFEGEQKTLCVEMFSSQLLA